MTLQRLTSTSPSFVAVNPTLPVSLAAGASQTVELRFDAQADLTEVQTATLRGHSDLGLFQLSLTGRSLWRGLTYAPEAIDFGTVLVGARRTRFIALTNPGNLPVAVAFTAPTDDRFAVEPLSLSLAGGVTQQVAISYEPREVAAAATNIALSGLATTTIPLTGRSEWPREGPVSIDFDLAPGNQHQRRAGNAAPGSVYKLQLHVRGVPDIEGWSASLNYDPQALAYVPGSFAPGDLFSQLVRVELATIPGQIEVGGHVLGQAEPSPGNGVLGTVAFRVANGFYDQSPLDISFDTFSCSDGSTDRQDLVRSRATITAEPVAPIDPGDFDGDGALDIDDFLRFADEFGQTANPANQRFDLDGDGRIFYGDFFIFADLFEAAGGRADKLSALAAELLAGRLQLRPGYPNPFNAETTIEYVLPAAGPVQLAVYDVHGQRVRMLADGHYGAGLQRVRWDGRDEDGRPAASGVYLYRIRADDRIQTRKLLLLK